MPVIHKTAIVPYCPENIYNLVNDIDNYSHYLPWCTKSAVINRTADQVTGKIALTYLKVSFHLITQNTNTPYSAIEMKLVEGSFKSLTGKWIFTPLGTNGCKVDLNLTYEFSNMIMEKLMNPAFSYIGSNIVNAFITEAHKQFG